MRRWLAALALTAACDATPADEPGGSADTLADAMDATAADAASDDGGADSLDAGVDASEKLPDADGTADAPSPDALAADTAGELDAGPGDAADTAGPGDASDTPDASPADVAPQPDVPPPPPPDYPNDDLLRLNHIQAKGTHNSYHLQPPDTFLEDWAYSHDPLDVQAGAEGVRQFELDVHLDPMVGFTVSHIPILDGETTCATLHECLATLKGWSDAHPGHHPLFVLIEPKDDVDQVKLAGHIAELDATILAVWPEDRVLTPDDVRGEHATLRDAILADGWPTLGATRNRLVVTILDSGAHRAEYLLGHPTLEGRVMFVDSDPSKEYAGIMLYDDPVGDAAALGEAVAAGYIVRTRADTVHGPLVANHLDRTQAALDSGAHLLSTDYPGPVEGIDYVLELPDGAPSRCNPLTAPGFCTSLDIEALGL